MIKILFGTITLSATLRLATPIIIAAVGGSFSHKAGTFNIAFECFMLFGAFFGAYGSYLTGNPMAGALLAALSGAILSLVFGLFVFILKANPMIISIAMNNGAWAVTTLMLTIVWGVRGSFVSPEIVSFKTLDIPILRNIPYIKNIANNQIILVYMAYAIIIIGTIVMYKTKFGLRVRGIGINDVAAQTAGVNVEATKWIALNDGCFCRRLLPIMWIKYIFRKYDCRKRFSGICFCFSRRWKSTYKWINCSSFCLC